jgi:hypothetical protein
MRRKSRWAAGWLLVFSVSSAQACHKKEGEMTAAYVEKLRNDSIQWATERPPGSPFVSAGREIRILEPFGLEAAAQSPNALVPALLACFDDADKDWAANLVLYALTGRDALPLSAGEGKIEDWRRGGKASDRRYWLAWWSANQGRLQWNGQHVLVPAA